MRYVTAEGTTCTLIVITTDKREADMQRNVIKVTDIPSVSTGKRILFFTGLSGLEKERPIYV
jgi:hypothetical protein